MVDSVKPYKRHFLICSGVPSSKWPNEVDKDSSGYIARFDKLLDRAKFDYDFKVTVTELPTVIDGSAVSIDSVGRADVMLFPDCLLFSALSLNDCPAVFSSLKQAGGEVEQRLKGLVQQHQQGVRDKRGELLVPKFDIPSTVTSLNATYFLICTHKLRDKRCSVTGAILMEELAAQASAAKIDTNSLVCLSTSHIGGHKFAANLIVYPDGEWLGRVSPCNVSAILDVFIRNNKSAAARKQLDDIHRGSMGLDW